MGAKCCTNRKLEARGNRVAVAPDLGSPRRRSMRAGSAQASERASSLGYNSRGEDADRFDTACESNDLQVFVELLQSTEPVESLGHQKHPWAEDPRTVGALAAGQLEVLASAAAKEDPAVKHKIRKAGAIAPLVALLRSGESDRAQVAAAALCQLTTDCPANAVQAYEEGALESLMAHMASPVAGMRATVAMTLRNLYIEREECCRQFVELGGIAILISQLSPTPDPDFLDTQLEAVLNLQDVLEDNDGGTIEAYAKQAIRAGAEARLQQMTAAVDREVRAAAEEVLAILAKAKG
mmetsp:Transcript_64078/g.198384  ORF Transcript_64078/g.198384 Transcript_64078/m.198384 type:complete len:295 (+) Transcript_64078:102-986(+)